MSDETDDETTNDTQEQVGALIQLALGTAPDPQTAVMHLGLACAGVAVSTAEDEGDGPDGPDMSRARAEFLTAMGESWDIVAAGPDDDEAEDTDADGEGADVAGG